MSFKFNQNDSDNIIKHFGRDFFEKVLRDIETYSNKWELEILEFVDYFSVNCIFICSSKLYGEVILKIGNPSTEVFTEYNTLCEYNGRRFCKVFDSNLNNGVILEEYIKPGIRLRDEKVLENRLCIFSDLYNGLHIEPKNANIYPTYFEWVNRITDFMKDQTEHRQLYLYMVKAKEICESLCKAYSKKVLLHGDLHHDNILLGNDNEYKIIDPQGVIGDPIFDISRFILNEFYGVDEITFDEYRKHIEKITNYFEKSLNVPINVIKKLIFIETTMANCWEVENSKAPEMDYVKYTDAML